MFSTLYNLFVEHIGGILVAFQRLFDVFFYKTLGEIIAPPNSPSWWANLIANIPSDLTSTTLISFILGTGILVFIALTIIKWFLDIFT